jgi:hypothetical protein
MGWGYKNEEKFPSWNRDEKKIQQKKNQVSKSCRELSSVAMSHSNVNKALWLWGLHIFLLGYPLPSITPSLAHIYLVMNCLYWGKTCGI